MLIKIDDVKVNDRIMKLEENNVVSLIDDIKENGLISPIAVDQDKNLLAGLHRYTACKRLGFEEIECNVVTIDGDTEEHKDYARARIEISENLVRKDISPFERARQLKLAFDMSMKLGEVENKSQFADKIAEETGGNKRNIEKDLRLTKLDDVDPTVLDKAIEHNVRTEIIKKLSVEQDQEKNIETFHKLINEEGSRVNRYTKDFRAGTVEQRLQEEEEVIDGLPKSLKDFADKYILPKSYRVEMASIAESEAKVEMLLELDTHNFKNKGNFIREAIPLLMRSWISAGIGSANDNFNNLVKRYTDLSETNSIVVPQDKLDRLKELRKDIVVETKEEDFVVGNATIVTKTRYSQMLKKADKYQLYFNIRTEEDIAKFGEFARLTVVDALIVCDNKKLYNKVVGGIKNAR